MKNKELNGVQVWKEFADFAVPRLQLNVIERAVYFHLLRHSRLEGKARLRFSILWLARGACLCTTAVRKAVRSLAAKGAIRLVERSRAGHVAEVRLPEEIRAVRSGKSAPGVAAREAGAVNIEEADFVESRALREAIHRRESGHCFYCMRRLNPKVRCLDHVIPCARKGRNSYRNLVSACMECNSQKGERKAEDIFRWLYREGRLTAAELSSGLRKLKELAAGKLRPGVEGSKEVREEKSEPGRFAEGPRHPG